MFIALALALQSHAGPTPNPRFSMELRWHLWHPAADPSLLRGIGLRIVLLELRDYLSPNRAGDVMNRVWLPQTMRSGVTPKEIGPVSGKLRQATWGITCDDLQLGTGAIPPQR